MFLKNIGHNQIDMFGVESQLPAKKAKKLEKSKEKLFYELIFCNIDEEKYIPLYSQSGSRPNSPINSLVSAIILQYHNGWSTNELLTNIDFNILTRKALGLQNLEDTPFCESTYYNFQNKLLTHWIQTGENLIESVFDNLTQKQIKKLNIKTNIQRMDSFQALSNIRDYSRVQILIECIIRLERILVDSDKDKFKKILVKYCKKTSSKYVYDLKKSDISHELEKLGNAYYELYSALKGRYLDEKSFQIFERIYRENFTEKDGVVSAIDSSKLSGNILQSPDDIDATYRKKNKKKNKGQVVNVSETAHPDNELNLIIDIAVASNTTDDSKILNNRIDNIKEKTPDLNELHTDGAYGSAGNDMKMEKNEINHVQTDSRGKNSVVPIDIEEMDDGEIIVKCPVQTATVTETKTKYKANFDKEKCKNCAYKDDCSTFVQKNYRTSYFDKKDIAQQKRKKNILNLPEERRTIRPNVEATMKEFTKAFNHKGKLKTRGKFKAMIFAFAVGIGINFGRIFRHILDNPEKHVLLLQLLLSIIALHMTFWLKKKNYTKLLVKYKNVFEFQN